MLAPANLRPGFWPADLGLEESAVECVELRGLLGPEPWDSGRVEETLTSLGALAEPCLCAQSPVVLLGCLLDELREGVDAALDESFGILDDLVLKSRIKLRVDPVEGDSDLHTEVDFLLLVTQALGRHVCEQQRATDAIAEQAELELEEARGRERRALQDVAALASSGEQADHLSEELRAELVELARRMNTLQSENADLKFRVEELQDAGASTASGEQRERDLLTADLREARLQLRDLHNQHGTLRQDHEEVLGLLQDARTARPPERSPQKPLPHLPDDDVASEAFRRTPALPPSTAKRFALLCWRLAVALEARAQAPVKEAFSFSPGAFRGCRLLSTGSPDSPARKGRRSLADDLWASGDGPREVADVFRPMKPSRPVQPVVMRMRNALQHMRSEDPEPRSRCEFGFDYPRLRSEVTSPL